MGGEELAELGDRRRPDEVAAAERLVALGEDQRLRAAPLGGERRRRDGAHLAGVPGPELLEEELAQRGLAALEARAAAAPEIEGAEDRRRGERPRVAGQGERGGEREERPRRVAGGDAREEVLVGGRQPPVGARDL